MQLVGTDGYRLGLEIVEMSGDWGDSVVIPAKNLMSLLKAVDGNSVEIGIDKKSGQVWAGNSSFFACQRLLQGDFPDFERILPSSFLTSVDVARDDFLKAVQQLSGFASHNSNIIYLNIDKGISFSTKDGQMGSGSVEIDARVEGDPVSIAFNYRYLREYLSVIGDGEVNIIFNGSLAPVRFIAKSSPQFLHIIMPVKP